MSTRPTCAAIVAPDHPLVDELVGSLGVEVERIAPGRIDASVAELSADRDGLVWIHMVPAGAGRGSELDEASLLLQSARTAQRLAAAAGTRVTFLALLPSRGLFPEGSGGLACDLARGAFDGLTHAEIGAWSVRGDRIVGVVYGGFEGHVLDGQRPAEEVLRRTPSGALATVGQLADAVRYLGSRRATYVTGTVLHVDGGWNAYSWIYPARTI